MAAAVRKLDEVSSSTEPSRGDFATKSAPITPAAPALFSTITGTSRRLASGPAMARAMTSLLPPGENGTTILIVFGIELWALVVGAKTTAATTQKARPCPNVRIRSFPGLLVERAIVAVFRELRPRIAARPWGLAAPGLHPVPLLSSSALLAGNAFMRSLRIICPNGHLGFAPIRVESFRLGVAARPDYIAADSGSDDVGPIPLGTDTSTSPRAWQTHDLEQMLLASRELRVPMIIGSAGDTGANSRVDLYVRDHQGSRRQARSAAIQARLLLLGDRQGGPAATHAWR